MSFQRNPYSNYFTTKCMVFNYHDFIRFLLKNRYIGILQNKISGIFSKILSGALFFPTCSQQILFQGFWDFSPRDFFKKFRSFFLLGFPQKRFGYFCRSYSFFFFISIRNSFKKLHEFSTKMIEFFGGFLLKNSSIYCF